MTKFAPHKALKLTDSDKLTFDERVAVHRAACRLSLTDAWGCKGVLQGRNETVGLSGFSRSGCTKLTRSVRLVGISHIHTVAHPTSYLFFA